MNLIQTFYTNLDPLEVIIFWGIIIVIILLIILVILLLTKKKKTKRTILNEYSEEFPILTEKNIKEEPTTNDSYNQEETIFSIGEENNLLEEIDPIIENIEEETEIKEQREEQIEHNKYKTTFEMPTAPYQRNVLREMSLSQTSPIGINRKDDYIKPQDLFEMYNKHEEKIELSNNHKTNIEIPKEQEVQIEDTYQQASLDSLEEPIEEDTDYDNEFIEETNIIEEQLDNNMDIERTQYEIEQEENAIISYKELMEKKDSIQTIDEEEAIISIEELLNKNNSKEQNKEESKLYNISENEENESFINELKQFRKDL